MIPRLKICDLTQFYSPVSGGVKRYLHEKGRYIEGQSEDSHLVIIPGERDERTMQGRTTIYTVRSPLLSKTTQYRALLRLGAVEEIVQREMPDLIESADPYQVGWKAVACGSSLRIPVVGFYHSHFPEAYLRSRFLGPISTELLLDAARRYVRRLYNRFERTFVPSPALGKILADWGVTNTVDVDLGVDTALFCPGEREAVGIPNGSEPRKVLLYVGRLAHEKNTETLLKAFALLHRQTPGRHHLVIVGDGLQRPLVESLRAETGEVTWIPYCGNAARLAAIYRAADLFIHPGVQETFGLVSLEAQACGTPVVGIRGSFMDRIIFTDQSQWATENRPEALAKAIRTHAESDRCDLRATGLAASRTVRGHYSWEAVFERLFTVYRETIGDYNRGNV